MIVKTCNIHLRNLRVIGSKLSYDLKRQLVYCLIFSKLDYCNGLLFGLPDCLIDKLQKVQNSCVRFLFGNKEIRKWDRISSHLKQAHFLPTRRRIEYKIALTVFKCLNNIAPRYVSNLITPGAKICRGFEGQKSRCRDKPKCQKSRHCRGKNRIKSRRCRGLNRENRGFVAANILIIAALSRRKRRL